MPKKVTAKQIERLQARALTLMQAQDSFHKEFRRLSQLPGWNEACSEVGIAENSDPGDWLC